MGKIFQPFSLLWRLCWSTATRRLVSPIKQVTPCISFLIWLLADLTHIFFLFFIIQSSPYYAAMPTFHKGWSYFLEHLIPASGVPHENSAIGQRVMKQNSIPIFGPLVPNDGPVNPSTRATENPSTQAPELPSSTPFPSLICGRGPPMPARSLISERVGGTDSSLATTPWPFLVSRFFEMFWKNSLFYRRLCHFCH